jgi:hypothetical protein
LEQLGAISKSSASSLLWANTMPSAVLLWNDFGPTEGHRQHLASGQPHAIDHTALKLVLKGPVLYTGKRPKIGLDCN